MKFTKSHQVKMIKKCLFEMLFTEKKLAIKEGENQVNVTKGHQV